MRRGMILLGLLISLTGCASYYTVVSTWKYVDIPEFNGQTKISSVQYGYSEIELNKEIITSVTVNDDSYTLLQLQVQNGKKDVDYDFYNIILSNNEKEVKPSAMIYYRGNTYNTKNFHGYKKPENETLSMTCPIATRFTVVLIYDTKISDRFRNISINGKTIPLSEEVSGAPPFIENYYEPPIYKYTVEEHKYY
jgi:hypothetical protein